MGSLGAVRPAVTQEWQSLWTKDGQLRAIDHRLHHNVERALQRKAVQFSMPTAST